MMSLQAGVSRWKEAFFDTQYSSYLAPRSQTTFFLIQDMKNAYNHMFL